jgi:hypothetical protein
MSWEYLSSNLPDCILWLWQQIQLLSLILKSRLLFLLKLVDAKFWWFDYRTLFFFVSISFSSSTSLIFVISLAIPEYPIICPISFRFELFCETQKFFFRLSLRRNSLLENFVRVQISFDKKLCYLGNLRVWILNNVCLLILVS